MTQNAVNNTMTPLQSRIQAVGSAEDTQFLQQAVEVTPEIIQPVPMPVLDSVVQHTQESRPARIELPPSSQFAREAAFHLNRCNYAVIPANNIKDGDRVKSVPKLKTIKGFWQQNQLGDPQGNLFNNAESAFAVVDNDMYKFLFIDLDLHKLGSLSTRDACGLLGIDEALYRSSMFQAHLSKRSIHLLFRLDNEMMELFRLDQWREENNMDRYFKSQMITTSDSRIPENVELKLRPDYGNVRLKPDKRIFLKTRDQFPIIPDYLKEIVMDIRNRNEQMINEQIQQAELASYRRQNMNMNELNADQQRRYKYGQKALNRIIEDIKNTKTYRQNNINNNVFRVGRVAVDWQLDLDLTYDLLLNASLSTGIQRKRGIDTVRNAWKQGLSKPAVQVFKEDTK